jgi:hypothetical protein
MKKLPLKLESKIPRELRLFREFYFKKLKGEANERQEEKQSKQSKQSKQRNQ